MESIIILAAGLSLRMNLNKQKALLNYKKKPLVVHNCINALSYTDKVIVVTGFESNLVKKALNKYPVTIIENLNYKEGQFSSLKKALEKVDKEDFFVTTADLINIDNSLYSKLSKNLKDYDYIRPCFNNTIGHPVLHKNFLKEVFLNSKYTSARETLKEYKEKLLPVNSSSCINDIDTYNDYLKIKDLS